MSPFRMVKVAQGLNCAHSERAVEGVPMFIRANARAEIECSAWKYASFEDTFEVRASLKELIKTLTIMFVNIF